MNTLGAPAHLLPSRLRNWLMSFMLIALVAGVVVWSLLINATDIVAGLLDHPTASKRSH